MTNYFKKRYAMSDNGARNLKKSITSHTFVNITKLFPPIIGFMFMGLISRFVKTKEEKSTQLLFSDMSTPKGDGEFNIYDDIREKLVNLGIQFESGRESVRAFSSELDPM